MEPDASPPPGDGTFVNPEEGEFATALNIANLIQNENDRMKQAVSMVYALRAFMTPREGETDIQYKNRNAVIPLVIDEFGGKMTDGVLTFPLEQGSDAGDDEDEMDEETSGANVAKNLPGSDKGVAEGETGAVETGSRSQSQPKQVARSTVTSAAASQRRRLLNELDNERLSPVRQFDFVNRVRDQLPSSTMSNVESRITPQKAITIDARKPGITARTVLSRVEQTQNNELDAGSPLKYTEWGRNLRVIIRFCFSLVPLEDFRSYVSRQASVYSQMTFVPKGAPAPIRLAFERMKLAVLANAGIDSAPTEQLVQSYQFIKQYLYIEAELEEEFTKYARTNVSRQGVPDKDAFPFIAWVAGFQLDGQVSSRRPASLLHHAFVTTYAYQKHTPIVQPDTGDGAYKLQSKWLTRVKHCANVLADIVDGLGGPGLIFMMPTRVWDKLVRVPRKLLQSTILAIGQECPKMIVIGHNLTSRLWKPLILDLKSIKDVKVAFLYVPEREWAGIKDEVDLITLTEEWKYVRSRGFEELSPDSDVDMVQG